MFFIDSGDKIYINGMKKGASPRINGKDSSEELQTYNHFLKAIFLSLLQAVKTIKIFQGVSMTYCDHF